MLFKTFALIFFVLPLGCLAQSDSTVSSHILTRLDKYAANHITEKAYLHLDKPYYAAGDTIYFKAYVTLGGLHQLSALSGVLHAELIDNSTNKISQSEILEITNGVAWGDFALPDSLPKGNYRLRVYTQWMRNDGQSGFFEQNVPVGSVGVEKIQKKSTTVVAGTAAATSKPDIQFFPEGGSLITGVNSKVAFKAIGSNGLGIAVKGEVMDNENKQVATFAAMHLGMGCFYLKPEAGKTYKAQLSYPNGAQDLVNLPGADDNGIALSVSNDSTLRVTITAGKACYKNNRHKTYTLAVYSGGILTHIICRLDSQQKKVVFLKQYLHTGIARLTLFSPGGEPLSERLVFIQNNDDIKLSLSSDKSNYAKREKVTIKLNAESSNGEASTGDFSIAVTDESKVPAEENNESTILNNLLLTSDLKGYVEQPNYYFTKPSPETGNNLDLLLLTQGYRGFSWKQVLHDTTKQATFPPEKLLSLSGTVKTMAGKPVPNSEVSLGLIKQMIARDTTTDVNGNFIFTNLYITDTAKVLLRAKGNKKIEVNEPAYPAISPIMAADTASSSPITPQIAAGMQKRYAQQGGSMKTGIVLKQVDINSRKDHPWTVHLVHSSNLNGPGAANQVILGDKLVGCADLAQCLASLIHGGVRFVGPKPEIYSVHTVIALSGPTKPMAVIVDGVIRDQSVLGEIPYTDVYSIEILLSYSYLTVYGSAASGGAIVITTRRGDERIASVIMQPGLTKYVFNGFYKAREFYSPKYEANTPVNSKADMRTTICWKPVLITDKDGNASFDFYNADGIGNYRVVVEGIDKNGNLGRQVYHYTVQ